MNEPRFTVEDPRVTRSQVPAGDDLLPPVEPPSAGFILQLFVIPALIVLMIVVVWLAFNWLVRTASRPEDVVKGLEHGPSVARWQRANELADMLRDDRYAEFKRNRESAQVLSRTLDREIQAAGMSENEIAFRMYLAEALGKFEVQDGMDVLLKAATTSRGPSEQIVRESALRAIAQRAYNLPRLKEPEQIEDLNVESTLLQVAGDEEPRLRRAAVFAMGQLGTPSILERLEVMLDDPDGETRYNAAVALAHRGNAKSVETLAEMLDLDEHAAEVRKAEGKNVAAVRGLYVHAAVEAALALAKQNSDVDLAPVVEMLQQIADASDEQLAKAQLPQQARFDARRALTTLQAKGTPAGAT
jgi:HEAT repeat protein